MTSIEEVLSDISKLREFQFLSVKSNIQQHVFYDALKSRILTVLDSISAPKVNTDDDKGTLSGKAKALAGSGGGCCGCVTIPLTLSNTGPTTISAPGNYAPSKLAKHGDHWRWTIQSQYLLANRKQRRPCKFVWRGVDWVRGYAAPRSPYPSLIAVVVIGGTGGVSSTTLTVTSVTSGTLAVGMALYAVARTGITSTTFISLVWYRDRWLGTYNMSVANTIANGTTISASNGFVNDARVDITEGIVIHPPVGVASLDNISICNGKIQYFANGISGQ